MRYLLIVLLLFIGCEDDSPTALLNIYGCTNESACNYNSMATSDNGTCVFDDECGVCDGNNSTCLDECGVINGDNSTCSDECGIPNGNGFIENGCCPGEVNFLNQCYNINETTELDRSDADDNWGSGEIPSELWELENLTYLDLSYTLFTGGIPEEISNLENLTHLDLAGTYIGGEIPEEIGSLTNLTYLNLHGCSLSGGIPSEIGDLASLQSLRLNNNFLTGEIPIQIWNLPNLIDLYLYDNELYGQIPDAACNYNTIALHTNQFCPNVPSCLSDSALGTQSPTYSNCGDLSGFTYIWDEYYNIDETSSIYYASGTLYGLEIPENIFDLINLQFLNLMNTGLTGTIPDSICNIDEIYLFGNSFCAPYPSCISQEQIDTQDTSKCP